MNMKPYMLEVFSGTSEIAEEYILSEDPISISIETLDSLSPNWHAVELRCRGELVARLTKN